MRNKFFGTGEPGFRPIRKLKVIKDIAAAAVGISMVVWLTVMILNGLHLVTVILN